VENEEKMGCPFRASKMTSIITVGSSVSNCMGLFIFKCFFVFVDLIKKIIGHGGAGFVYVAEDQNSHIKVALKLIYLGTKGGSSRSDYKKTIEKEVKVGIVVARECKFLASYLESFEWEDYFCIKMEYYRFGDIQYQLDTGRVFTEDVCNDVFFDLYPSYHVCTY
jgi:serine/threonine protein kinase